MRAHAEPSSEHDRREARLAFEALAARQAAVHRSAAQAEALLEAAERVGAVAGERESTETAAATTADAAFRRCLADAARVPMLRESLDLLAEHSPARPIRLAAVAYAQLAEAVHAADPDDAERAVRELHQAEWTLQRREVLGRLPRPGASEHRPA